MEYHGLHKLLSNVVIPSLSKNKRIAANPQFFADRAMQDLRKPASKLNAGSLCAKLGLNI